MMRPDEENINRFRGWWRIANQEQFVTFFVIGLLTTCVMYALKTDYLRENESLTMSRLYFVVVWFLIAFGSLVLISGLNEPTTLLIIASSLSAVVMVFYSALLIMINRQFMPEAIRLGSWRLVAMVLAFLFYLFFAGWFVLAEVGSLFGFGG
jgi:hypothetical protein